MLTTLAVFTRSRPPRQIVLRTRTSTRSPGSNRTQFLTAAPAPCARTCALLLQFEPVQTARQCSSTTTRTASESSATPSWPGQNPGPVRRHRHAVLEVGRIRIPVLRHRRPRSFKTFASGFPAFTIGSIASTMPSLNRGFSLRLIDIVRNLRLFMQLRPDSMPHILPHDRKPVLHHVLLDRPANVEQPVARREPCQSPVRAIPRSLSAASSPARSTRPRRPSAPNRRNTLPTGLPYRSTRCRPSSQSASGSACHARSLHSPKCRARIDTFTPPPARSNL